MSWEVIQADCVEAMQDMDEASVDAIVCDPPYGLEFMGKEWDRLADSRQPFRGEVQTPDNPYGRTPVRYGYNASAAMQQQWHQAWATEALRVLRPGGHLLAFGGTRTYHRLACAVEDAGFEIRDSVIWLYGSGFPKSHNLNGDHEGWGTALKPAHEPIVVARKPLIGTVAQNVQEHGTGALNVDGCRIEGVPPSVPQPEFNSPTGQIYGMKAGEGRSGEMSEASGRWPPNVTLSPEAAEELDRQSGEVRSPKPYVDDPEQGAKSMFSAGGVNHASEYGDTGGASRFFYVAKASRAERNAGLDGFEERARGDLNQGFQNIPTGSGNERNPFARNHHPTVKPIALMRWLVRLVTPPNGTILDPFTGSGTTGIAAVLEDFDFIGIEREGEYVEIARARIQHHAAQPVQEELL